MQDAKNARICVTYYTFFISNLVAKGEGLVLARKLSNLTNFSRKNYKIARGFKTFWVNLWVNLKNFLPVAQTYPLHCIRGRS